MYYNLKSLLLPFVALLLLFPILSAGGSELDPKQVGQGVFEARLLWNINLNSAMPSSISFSTFNFFDNVAQDSQITSSTHLYSQRRDEFGNEILTFQLDRSRQTQQIVLNARIVSMPENFQERVTEDLSRFSEQSYYVTITPAIASKAREVVGSEGNALKKATLLTEWVHNNIVYDLAYKNDILSSEQVYEIRRGVCNEYSHLLIAMLRSQGIPARFVAGYVYSGEVWAPHAWIEVAVDNQWFPFDPTYNEGMVLDATHLKFAQGVDQNDVKEQLTATGVNDLSRVSITRDQFITVSSTQPPSFSLGILLTAPGEIVEQGSIQTLTASITNNASRTIAFPLSLAMPEELRVLNQRNFLLFFFPGETKQVTWQLLVPSDLRDGFVYTYPLVVRSLGGVNETTLHAKKGAGSSAVEEIQIREIRLTQNQSQLIATIQNAGNVDMVQAVAALEVDSQTSTQVFSLPAGESTTLIFPLSSLNFSAAISGNLVINSTGLSVSQLFTIEPTVQSEPTLPAFNIQTTTQGSGAASEAVDSFPLFAGLAITILIVLLLIISKTQVRS